MVFNHTLSSGTSNVTKARVFEGTFVEFGIGFVENEQKYDPWLILNVGGGASKVMDFVESFADVIVSEGEIYRMHSKAGSVNLHGEDDELDEIIDELSTQLVKFKRFDDKRALISISSPTVNQFYKVKGFEALDSAIKSCLGRYQIFKFTFKAQSLR